MIARRCACGLRGAVSSGRAVLSIQPSLSSEACGHPRDVAGNLRSVAEARTMADLVLVAHHFSVSEGGRGNKPCFTRGSPIISVKILVWLRDKRRWATPFGSPKEAAMAGGPGRSAI